MAVVKPFRALRYDVAKAGPLERLIAPPYDVIDAEQRDERLERPGPPHVVAHGAKRLHEGHGGHPTIRLWT